MRVYSSISVDLFLIHLRSACLSNSGDSVTIDNVLVVLFVESSLWLVDINAGDEYTAADGETDEMFQMNFACHRRRLGGAVKMFVLFDMNRTSFMNIGSVRDIALTHSTQMSTP